MKKKFISLCFLTLFLITAISPTSYATAAPEISAEIYLVMVPETGQIVLSQNAEENFEAAELITVFSLLTIINQADQEQEITVPENLPLPNNSLQLKPGEVYTVADLIEMTALNSSVQSLYTLAVSLYGSEEAFLAEVKNDLASIGCSHTNINSLNYKDEQNLTTASDLALAAREYAKNELLSGTFKTVYKEYSSRGDGATPFAVYSTNSLVSNYRHSSYLYRYAYGIKEAYCAAEKENHVVTYLKNGSKELILILARAKQSDTEITAYTDVKKMGNYLFEQFSTRTLVSKDEPVTEYIIDNAPKGTHIILKALESKSAFLSIAVSEEEIDKKVTCQDNIRAPIKKGDVLGEVSFYFQGNLLSSTPLYSDRTIEYHPTVSGAGVAFRILTHPVTIAAILGFIIIFILLFLRQIELSRKKAKKKGKNR